MSIGFLLLPGSGINPNNILIFKAAGFREVHCSAVLASEIQSSAPIMLNSPVFLNDGQEIASNQEVIKAMIALMND